MTELQLAHFSVQEYLLSGRVEQTFRDYFQESRARACIAQVGIAYLYEASQTQQEDIPDTQLPLREFAAEYWMGHALLAEKAGKPVVDWVHKLLTSERSRKYWLDYYNPNAPYSTLKRAKVMSALYYASLGGLTACARILLHEGTNESMYGNAIGAASARGHKDVLKLLLDRGPCVAQRTLCSCAIQAAAEGGHQEVVELLLDAGANIDDAIHAAALGGHQGVAKMLLDRGADVDVRGRGYYGSPLQAALGKSHQGLTKMLLGAGANANGTLYIASVSGHREEVKALLDNATDVNFRGGGYGNALEAASRKSHEEVVKMLLDGGAVVNSQVRCFYKSALEAALREGHQGVVKSIQSASAQECAAACPGETSEQ